MAKLPIDEIRDSYDNLVKKLMDELKKVIEDLMKQKKKMMDQRRITMTDMHQARREMFTANKGEFYANAEAKENPEFENKKNRIDELEEQLKGLLETELTAEGGNYNSHAHYQNAMDVTIGQLNGLLNYINNNSGAGRRLLFIRSNKGKRRHLPIEAIFEKISELSTVIEKREGEEELNEERFLAFKLKVETEADSILRSLGTVTGVTTPIKKPRTARVRRSLRNARGNIGKKATNARQKVAGGILNLGKRIPDWVKQNPNPVPTLQNWWANVANTAKRLREKAKKKGDDVTEELAEAVAEDETVPEANEKFESLQRIIDNVKNFNPKESAKLVGLGNRLSGYQTTISEGLKKLRESGLSEKDSGKAAEDLERAAEGAKETAGEIERELGRWQRLTGWLRSKAPDINLRGRFAGARRAVGGRIPRPNLGAALGRIIGLSVPQWVKDRMGNVASGGRMTGGQLNRLATYLRSARVPTTQINNIIQSVRNRTPAPSGVMNGIINSLGSVAGRVAAGGRAAGRGGARLGRGAKGLGGRIRRRR